MGRVPISKLTPKRSFRKSFATSYCIRQSGKAGTRSGLRHLAHFLRRAHSKGALRRIVVKFGLERYCRIRCSRRLFDPSPKRVVSRRFRCRTSANRLAAAIEDFGFVSAPPQRQLIEPSASNPRSPNFRAHTGIVAWRCDVETATSAKSPAQIGAGQCDARTPIPRLHPQLEGQQRVRGDKSPQNLATQTGSLTQN
jgi:hypothetical protein